MNLRTTVLNFFTGGLSLVSSKIIARQGQTPGDAFWNSVGGTIDWGLSEGTKLFLPPIQEAGDSIRNLLTPDENSKPVYKLHIDCDAQKPGQCKVTTKYIIWAKACSPQYEAAIATFLAAKVDGKPINTARDTECNAVDFWSTELTEDEAKEARQLEGVMAVEPNEKIDLGKIGTQPVQIQHPHQDAPLQKRDRLLEREDFEDGVLSFLSKGFNADESNTYYIFSKNGRGITLYLPGTGVQFSHSEFIASSHRVLYSFDVSKTPTDEAGTGTCHGSLACGRFKGVAGSVDMVVVKHTEDEDSVLNAMLLILMDLENRVNQGEEIKGYSVISVPYGWLDRGRETDNRMKARIIRMLRNYQAVVVAAAGDASANYKPGSYIPAGLSTEYPIIAAGAVDISTGRKYARSPVGDFVTTLAPGSALCAAKEGGQFYIDSFGTAAAAAYTAGLAAYLLSLEDLGPILRWSVIRIGVPAAVRDWIVDKAWARKDGTDADKAIWNGIRIVNGVASWDYRMGLGTKGGWSPSGLRGPNRKRK